MRVTYRRRGRNVLWGVATGSMALFTLMGAVGFALTSSGAALWVGFWPASLVAITATTLVVRCLRRGVVVDDIGITARGAWSTWFVAWQSIKDLRCAGIHECVIERIGGGEPLTVVVRPTCEQPTLTEACDRWRREPRDFRGDPRRYPRAGREWVLLVFIASVVALIIGLPVWIQAVSDGNRYAARAAREREGVAVVSDVWIKETGDGEGGHEHTTYVAAWLRVGDARVYEIKVHRPGDVASRYDEEDQLPVVYDSAHPRDADFADGPTREAQDDSVSLRKTTGPLLLFGGLVGGLVASAVMGHDWRRRLG